MSVIDYILTRGSQWCPALGPLLALSGNECRLNLVEFIWVSILHCGLQWFARWWGSCCEYMPALALFDLGCEVPFLSRGWCMCLVYYLMTLTAFELTRIQIVWYSYHWLGSSDCQDQHTTYIGKLRRSLISDANCHWETNHRLSTDTLAKWLRFNCYQLSLSCHQLQSATK